MSAQKISGLPRYRGIALFAAYCTRTLIVNLVCAYACACMCPCMWGEFLCADLKGICDTYAVTHSHMLHCSLGHIQRLVFALSTVLSPRTSVVFKGNALLKFEHVVEIDYKPVGALRDILFVLYLNLSVSFAAFILCSSGTN